MAKYVIALVIILGGSLAAWVPFVVTCKRLPHGAELWNWLFGLTGC